MEIIMAILPFMEWLNRKVMNDAVLPKLPYKIHDVFKEIPKDADHAIEMAKDRYMKFEDILNMVKKRFVGDKGEVIMDIKSKSSIERKMRDKGRGVEGIGDILRATIVTDTKEQSKEITAFLNSKFKHDPLFPKNITAVGYEAKDDVGNIKNPKTGKIEKDKTGWRGSYHIDLNIDGMQCELQIMPKDLWRYKNKVFHPLFDYLRTGKDIPDDAGHQARGLAAKVSKQNDEKDKKGKFYNRKRMPNPEIE